LRRNQLSLLLKSIHPITSCTMSYNNLPFVKEKSLFDTDMNLFSSPQPPTPNEKTSLLPSLATLFYHQEEQEDYPSKFQAGSRTEATAANTDTIGGDGDDAAASITDTTATTTAVAANESIQEQDEDDEPETSPLYENLLQQATLWTMEMRSLRDDIFMLQIRTAIKLDHLTMLGADDDDEMMDFEY
jgi:hypothetical protein